MRELRLENMLKDVQAHLEFWAGMLVESRNIREWMLLEANKIRAQLETKE